MSEDPNLLRDEVGNPLTSIFHAVEQINFWEYFASLPFQIFFLELEPMRIHDVEKKEAEKDK